MAADERPSTSEDAALRRLLAREWDYRLRQNPTFSSTLGDRRWNRAWEDLSLQAFGARSNHYRWTLKKLDRIDPSKLSPADKLNWGLFRREMALEIEELGARWYLLPMNQREGHQTAHLLADDLRFQSIRDYLDWNARLRGVGRSVDQAIALMREGIRTRRVHARVIAERIVPQIAKQIVDDPEESLFLKPYAVAKETGVNLDLSKARREAVMAIREVVIPAYQRLEQFFQQEYLPACFEKEGIWQMPDGAELYAFLARKFTTTRLTPDQIHDLGLSEVSRVREEMEKIRHRVQFRGSLREFFVHLRTDPQFAYRSPGQLLAAYKAAAKRVDPLLNRVFRTLPRIPYGVEPIPDGIAPHTTTAYYRPPAADGTRPGFYSVNLYRPETRFRHEIMALTLHEAVPGHHLQIALSMEQGNLPHFRRYGGYTVFVEGWALYAESLGDELGLYEDPYDKMGQLTYEMWRAVRLVVDTGIHAKRWSRKQAIDFFTEHAPKSELDIANEIDRYIAWPGQALAYKIGELKIKELRALAQRELGVRFDLRAFHDAVLLAGALPLDLLETRVLEWIRTQ
ncbi:MAG: DUF885 domain-containing protein [Verrucomicrobia bacterium]|nr:DUF885 domain-containing protein [Verrucomicrobiota bacterium]